jgi:prepilin-type processing-associated H-X9-DG protein
MDTAGRLSRAEVIVIALCVLTAAVVVNATDDLLQEYERRIACASNLKALATAQCVYANDYEDRFARQRGWQASHWTRTTPGWDDPQKVWGWQNSEVTVGASLYLLVREVDVNPALFVCPASGQRAYDGSNPNDVDMLELWDFGSIDYKGTGPKNCVSYSYQMPYSPYAADQGRPWSFAVMADRSPWYDSAIRKGTPSEGKWKEHVGYIVWDDAVRGDRDWQLEVGNSETHWRDGQNVFFADGHVEFVLRPDVGVRQDNIFTPQGGAEGGGPDFRRMGQMPHPYGIGYGQPQTEDDSFLVSDDENNPCSADQPGDLNADCSVDMGDLAALSEHWLESTRVD